MSLELQPDFSKERNQKWCRWRVAKPSRVFEDAGHVTHVSVSTMSLGLNSPTPLFLTVSDVTFKDTELFQLQNQFHTFRAKRGSITTPGMTFYIQHIITPYIGLSRTSFNDQDLKIYRVSHVKCSTGESHN
jgi:hypothetical protein